MCDSLTGNVESGSNQCFRIQDSETERLPNEEEIRGVSQEHVGREGEMRQRLRARWSHQEPGCEEEELWSRFSGITPAHSRGFRRHFVTACAAPLFPQRTSTERPPAPHSLHFSLRLRGVDEVARPAAPRPGGVSSVLNLVTEDEAPLQFDDS